MVCYDWMNHSQDLSLCLSKLGKIRHFEYDVIHLHLYIFVRGTAFENVNRGCFLCLAHFEPSIHQTLREYSKIVVP